MSEDDARDEPASPPEPKEDGEGRESDAPSSLKKDGTLIAGKYQVISLLGKGGMGAVYEVLHVGVKRKFALKMMSRDVSEHRDAVRRFTQEAQAAARIGSRHIVDVFDLGEDADGSLYMVMELLRGETLHKALESKIAVARAVKLTCDLLSALEEAHAHGIVHRDVKPQNLFLAQKTGENEPVLKVLDFGIAKFREVDDETGSASTNTGVVIGTPLYMAPEQVMGDKEIDGRVDVWAAGATLFEMLTGRSVHLAPNATAAAVRVVTEKAPRADSLRPDVPRALADIVEKALSIEREQRFASASDMRAALVAFLAGDAADIATNKRDAHEVLEKRPRSRSRLWLIGLVAFVSGVVVVAIIARPSQKNISGERDLAASATASVSANVSAQSVAPSNAVGDASTTAVTISSATPNAPSASASEKASPQKPPRIPTMQNKPAPAASAKPSCSAGDAMSLGHCCPTGHVWEADHCARPVATSFP